MRNAHGSGAIWQGPEYVRLIFNECGTEDAAYIVHACNAYPQLVAALRYCADNVAGCVEERDIPSTVIRDNARALLRSLGEAE